MVPPSKADVAAAAKATAARRAPPESWHAMIPDTQRDTRGLPPLPLRSGPRQEIAWRLQPGVALEVREGKRVEGLRTACV